MSDFDSIENNTVRKDTGPAEQETATSFQDELRKNMRLKEDVEKELEERIQKEKEREKREMEAEAMLTLQKIKEELLQNVKAALYTTENGVTTVSCRYDAPSRFLRHRWMSNSLQVNQNNKAFILLRNPTLRYQSWDEFSVNPKYSLEYEFYSEALKRLAAEENISIEFVVCNVSGHGTSECPFPSNSKKVEISKGALCIRACTVISTEPSADQAVINEVEQEKETAAEEKEQTNNKRSLKSIGKIFAIIILVILIHVVVGIICWNIEDLALGFVLFAIDVFLGVYLVIKK